MQTSLTLKLTKVESENSCLFGKLIEVEADLHRTLDEVACPKKLLANLEGHAKEEKLAVGEAAVAAFKASTEFSVSLLDYFYNGFYTLRR